MFALPENWPAIVQAVSAAAVAVLTIKLAIDTGTYARLTREALELSNRRFEHELLPSWHISFAHSAEGTAVLKIVNLSKNSARVTHLSMRVETEHEPEWRRFPLDLGMPAGNAEVTRDVSPDILETVRPYMLNNEWNGILEIGLVFLLASSSEPRPSEVFQFRAAVIGGRFVEATARLPYIAGDLRIGAGR